MSEKKVIIITLLAILAFLLLSGTLIMCLIAGTYRANNDWIPTEDQWYCDDLQLILSFGVPEKTYIIHKETNQKVSCYWGSDLGSGILYVACNEENAPWELGEGVFLGKYVSQTDTELVLRDYDTGIEYTFRRIDE